MSDSVRARLWDRIKRLFGRGHDFISIVMLLRAPRALGEAELRLAVEKAWGLTSGEDRDSSDYVVVNGPVRFVQVRGYFFNILSMARPYIERREEFAAELKDLRTRTAVLEHQAWMSVDFVRSAGKPLSKNEKYSAIGKLVAELLGDDCLAVCLPDEDIVIAVSGELAMKLREMQSLEDLVLSGSDPVIEVNPKKAEAAAAEARSKWQVFVSAFCGRKPGDRFLVKKRFAEEENVEFMWIEVGALAEGRISGVLISEPAWLKQPRTGEDVSLKSSEVEDWAYISNGKMHGMFLKESKPAAKKYPSQG